MLWVAVWRVFYIWASIEGQDLASLEVAGEFLGWNMSISASEFGCPFPCPSFAEMQKKQTWNLMKPEMDDFQKNGILPKKESFWESMKRCQVRFPWGLAAWPGWECISFCAGTARCDFRWGLISEWWHGGLRWGSLEVVMGYKIGLYDRYNWGDMGPLFQWPKLNWVSLGLFHPEKKCWSYRPLHLEMVISFGVWILWAIYDDCDN